MAYNVLILGASYGSLFGTKLLMAGHRVSLVCTRPTAELINREGTIVRFPIKGREALLDIASKELPGTLSAATPDEVDPGKFDLVVLGMQEAQYGATGVRELMGRVARVAQALPGDHEHAAVALPQAHSRAVDRNARGLLRGSRRLGGLRSRADDAGESRSPGISSAGSAQERSPGGLADQLQGGALRRTEATTLLRQLEADIEAARFDPGDGPIEIPVKLKVHDSIFVPLAKWPMLMAGNYRCIRRDDMIPIKEAVHANIDKSREIYDWVWRLCAALGADDDDMVPFEKYAKAAEGLGKPSSAARALFGGAEHIERVDCLVRRIARQQGLQSDTLDEIVTLVDERLARNRSAERVKS